MMSLTGALLAADAGKIARKATKDFEVERLSEILGEPFILHLQQVPSRRVREIQDSAMQIDTSTGQLKGVDNYELQMRMLCDGITNKDFDGADVLKHYNVASRKELFSVLFNAGEVQDIANAISELCGFGQKQTKKTVEAVKN